MPEIALEGCAPVPLAGYLKALGVFRLVAEQSDKGVRGYWRDEGFVLQTTLTNEDLVRFFLEEYRPSPIISPWNGRAGFLEGEDDEESTRSGAELVRLLQGANAPRFKALKNAVDGLLSLSSLKELNTVRDCRKKLEDQRKVGKLSDKETANLNAMKKHESTLKKELITELRGAVSDQVVEWMDACWRIGALEDSAPPAPLLGSGGNDGSRDLGVNFGQQLALLFDLRNPEGASKSRTEFALKSAIFGVSAADLKRGAMGQFAPANAGPNAGVGFDATAPLNPWDTVLSLEGAIVFAGAATRRLGSVSSESSFPFTVSSSGAAGAGSALSDETEARGEVWMPLWKNPATFIEIDALFSEGRATLRRRPVRDGLDFARAAVTLGVNRGISFFQRYSFMKREGRSYIATPLTRIRVYRNFKADLLNDFDQGAWLQRFRSYIRTEESSARLRSIAEELDSAIFAFTQDDSHQAAQRVLIAVGDSAAHLASSSKARDPKGSNLRPPPRLSCAWFDAANDGTPEFRIATALAALGRASQTDNEVDDGHERPDQSGDPDTGEQSSGPEEDATDVADQTALLTGEGRTRKIPPPPFRAHLAPLDEMSWYGLHRKWSESNTLAVCGAGALERNLIAVLERRHLFAARRNLTGGMFDGRAPADLTSVLAFLARDTDDAKIAALAQGLAWAEPTKCIPTKATQTRPLPLAYALMKPFFAPAEQLRELGVPSDGAALLIPQGLVPRLRAGDVGTAAALACRRAQASGLPVTFNPSAEHVARLDGQRLLASLLIPIRAIDLKHVLKRAYPALFDDKETPEPKEEPPDAA